MKFFHVSIHHPKAPRIIQVNWYKPPCGWIKCNPDGASRRNPGLSTYGGIFRDSSGAILGCFSDFIGVSTSFNVELVGPMKAIELVYQKGWSKLWLECDSSLVVAAFYCIDLVPWKHKNRWRICLALTKNMLFQVTHTFREGNTYADKLANFGINSLCFTWWDLAPKFILEDFNRNRCG